MRNFLERAVRAVQARAPRLPFDRAIAAASTLLILAVTLYPFSFQGAVRLYDLPRYFEGLEHTGLFGPLVTPHPGSSLLDVVEPLANILLFVPLGFSLASVLKKRGHRWLTVFIAATALGSGLSLFVESVQVFIPARHSTVMDLLTNSLGALLGCAGFRLWKEPETLRAAWTSPQTWALGLATYVAFVIAPSLYVAYAPHLWNPGNWTPTFPLLVGNETTGDRPWKGHVSQLFLSDRALSESDVAAAFSAGEPVASTGETLLAAYALEGENRYPDLTGSLPRLSWTPAPPRDVPAGSLPVNPRHWLTTDTATAPLAERVRASAAFTLGVTFTPRNVTQKGPARIVSNSGGPSERNFMLGQRDSDLVLRLRTPFTGANGNNVAFVVPDVLSANTPHRVVVTYDRSALRIYVDEAEDAYAVELTPSTRAAWFLSYLATGRFEVDLREAESQTHRPLYYGLLFAPLALVLVLLASNVLPSRHPRIPKGQ